MAIDYEELLQGVCVIIDDEIKKPDSPANNLVKSIKEKGIPIIEYDTIPESAIKSFHGISYMILDWCFKKPSGVPEDVSMGDAATETAQNNALAFLKEILNQYFIPIFILTGQDFDAVKNVLIEEELFRDNEPNRIMVIGKNEIDSYEGYKRKITEWMRKTPSALALKIWEKEASVSKHKMFNDLYRASPRWVKILRESIDNDTGKNEKATNQEFQGLLNNNFINRMKEGEYSKIEIRRGTASNPQEIQDVLEGERFIRYSEKPDSTYTGDLYKKNDPENDEYYLNIRAQCDNTHSEDANIYVLTGKKPRNQITRGRMKLLIEANDEGAGIKAITINGKKYSKGELEGFSNDDIQRINAEIEGKRDAIAFSNGELIAKKTEAFLPCVDGQQVLHFDFHDFQIYKKEELEAKATLIGRLIPPYITKIQQEFSAYMIRAGVMALPPELFFDN